MAEKIINHGWFNILIAVVWVATYFGSRIVLERSDLDRTARVVIAVLPAIPFAAFLWLFVRNIGKLDEMQRKIQMEAMAFAFPLAVLLLMVLGLLQLAMPLPPEDLSYRHVWSFLPLFYLIGLALAWRRYK